jgi:site-specific recombinase XerD
MTASLHMVSASPQFDAVEAELAKDIWDVRLLPGVRYTAHSSNHLLNFTPVPTPFRQTVKQYLKFLLTQKSHSHCAQQLHHVRLFLQFFVELRPEARNLHQLARDDLERYLFSLKGLIGKPNRWGTLYSQRHMWEAVISLRRFFEYLERTSHPDAPATSVGKLIWPGDEGKRPRQKYTEDKYIPETVLRQLEQHMHNLPSRYLPIVIILRASGWRIGDVLNLRYETCLERSSSGWWLCGDILKTDVENHKVPISEEIAAIIAAQCEIIKGKASDQENPHRYLFPSPQKRRRGRPLYYGYVQDVLNQLATTCEIKGEDGSIFHFKNHAFRHPKAVELINAGMSLVHVQKWLAHLTPEMTLAYAKILDSTRRKEWEQAFAKGAVRIDVQGKPKVVSTEQLGNGQEIEWEHIRHNLDAVRLPNGYCFKPKKANCPTQDTPCYTCHHFCTTPDFLPQFEHEEREMRELIELGEKAGSEIWVERNTQKLNRLLPVIQVLRKGDLHHPAGKAMREYTPEERAKRNGG